MNPWDLPSTGGLAYDDYRRSMDAWMRAHPYMGQEQYDSRGVQDLVNGSIDSLNNLNPEHDSWEKQQLAAFGNQLTPAQQAEYTRLAQERNAKLNRNGKLAGLAALGGIAGIGALGAGMGALGSGAGALEGVSTMGGGGLDLFGGGFGFLPADIGNLPVGMFGSEFGSLPGLGGLGALGGAVSGGLGGLGALNGAGSGTLSVLKDLGSLLGGGGQNQGRGAGDTLFNGGLGLSALSAIMALRNKMPLPGVPNFMDLAEKTAASQNQQLAQQTLANRPNQVNAQGDTLSWMQDPSGKWTQTVQYSAPNQQRMAQQQQMAATLRGNIMNSQKNPAVRPAMDSFAWGG